MTPRVRAWLDEVDEETKERRIEYMARLAAYNRGQFTIGADWAEIALGGIYGRTGLGLHEALALAMFAGNLGGLALVDQALVEEIGAEISACWAAQRDRAATPAPLAKANP